MGHPKDQKNTKNNIFITNFLVISTFLLLWSNNAYFILGNSLKLICLFFGFIGVFISAFYLRFSKNFIKFSIKSLFFFLLFVAVAHVNHQNTLDSNNLLFGVICLLLLLSGFLIGQHSSNMAVVNKITILFLCFLTILGAYFFIKNQTMLSVENSISQRIGNDGSDDNINAVGIAYCNANIFFILFYFINQDYLKKIFKIIIFVTLISVLIVIISTGSRGALLFVFFVVSLTYINRLKSIVGFVSIAFKTVLTVVLVIGLFLVFSVYFPVLDQKFNMMISRFELLFEFFDTGGGDLSAIEREGAYNHFYTNLNDFILFGEKKYSPYPHNIFMEILLRWGFIFGFPLIIFIVLGFIKAFKLLIKNSNFQPFYYLYIYFLLFSFLQALSSLSLEMNRILWLSLGVVYGISIKKNSFHNLNRLS